MEEVLIEVLIEVAIGIGLKATNGRIILGMEVEIKVV